MNSPICQHLSAKRKQGAKLAPFVVKQHGAKSGPWPMNSGTLCSKEQEQDEMTNIIYSLDKATVGPETANNQPKLSKYPCRMERSAVSAGCAGCGKELRV